MPALLKDLSPAPANQTNAEEKEIGSPAILGIEREWNGSQDYLALIEEDVRAIHRMMRRIEMVLARHARLVAALKDGSLGDHQL